MSFFVTAPANPPNATTTCALWQPDTTGKIDTLQPGAIGFRRLRRGPQEPIEISGQSARWGEP